SDSDEDSTLASDFNTPRKINGFGIHAKIKETEVLMKNREASPFSSSLESIPSFHDTSIVYFDDDLKAKSSNQERGNGGRSASSVSNGTATLARARPNFYKKSQPPEIKLHRRPTGIPSSNNRAQMPGKYRHSLDSSIGKWNKQNG